MGKMTIEIDEATLSGAEKIARAEGMTVEQWMRQQVEQSQRLLPVTISNPNHRAILSALNNANEGRDELYDRAKQRAESYVENRKRLLDRIDATEGDMGTQGWDRRRAYER